MSRYKSSSKLNKNFDNDIIFEDDFDQDLPKKDQNAKDIAYNPQYKSIPTKAEIFQNYQQTLQEIQPNRVEKLNVIVKDLSSEDMRQNNEVGNKVTQEDNNHNGKNSSQYNPEARHSKEPRTCIQQNTNEKLKKMVQQQIQQRQKWQKNVAKNDEHQQNPHQGEPNLQTIQSNDNITLGSNQLLVVNDLESFKKMNSKQKLAKISDQKFAAINLQKNHLFEQIHPEDGEYITSAQKLNEQKKQGEEFAEQKKNKRSVQQLQPLKKKPSTYQLDMANRPQESEVISLADNGTPTIQSLIKKQSKNQLTQKAKTQPKTRIIGVDIKNLSSFVKTSLQKDKYIEANVHRDSSCIGKAFFPEYCIQIDEAYALHAKKTLKGYNIFVGDQENSIPLERMQKVASVKGNLMGSSYNIFNGPNQEQIIATVFYNSEVTTKSIVRDVELYVRSPQKNSDGIDFGMSYNRDTNLKTLYHMESNNGKIKKYIPKVPSYDQQTKMYTLDFGTKRITMPSVKNVILVNSQNQKEKVLVFGKCGYDNFYLRVESPLSPIIAMGYLMTSFNFKWVTQ